MYPVPAPFSEVTAISEEIGDVECMCWGVAHGSRCVKPGGLSSGPSQTLLHQQSSSVVYRQVWQGREAQGLEATPGVLRCHGAVRRLCDLLCRLDRGRKNTRGVPFYTGVRGYARVRMHTPAPVRTGARPARRVPMRAYTRTPDPL